MLNWRSALAARTARRVYTRIGERIAGQGYDVFSGRAYVPTTDKLLLVLSALALSPNEAMGDFERGFAGVPLADVVRFPGDILPV